ncbi:TVP38/TMEM64 family protein [Oryzomonas rubra]|nr:TVP38/TMEM64 family protein [Oryzomonas rubra]
MRREAVDRGFGSFREHRGLLGYERTGTSRRFSWYGLPEGCTTIFFPGCALPGTRPGVTVAVYERLKEVFPDLGLLFNAPKPSSGPVTYVNRLRLKSRFKRIVPAVTTRERTVPGGGSGMLRPLLFLGVMIAAIVLVRASGAGQYLEPERLRALFSGFGIVAPLVYIAIYTVAPTLMLPGLPLSMAGATVFGPVWGVVYTIIGATLGACAAFLIARYAARDWVERQLVGSRWNKLDSETAQNGWKAVAFTRLIPLFPFNLLNFAFGLTKISFPQYAVATFIFMLPGTIAFITFSSSLLGLLKGKVSREFFIGIVLIVAVSLIPRLAKWYRRI